MKKSAFVGLMVGILSGVAALLMEYGIGMMTDLWFEELSPFSIMLACILTNVAGALIFKKLDQKTSRARLYYGMVVGGVTLLATLNTTVNPPQEQFGIVGHPVHILVAILSLWLIPNTIRRNSSVMKDNSTAKAN